LYRRVCARMAFLLFLVSIFFICWMKGSVLLYLSPIIFAKLMQARPFPREDEWTTEWHKPAKFRVYIVLFGANVNTLWCKLSHLFVVEWRLIFESSVSEKCFSIILLMQYTSCQPIVAYTFTIVFTNLPIIVYLSCFQGQVFNPDTQFIVTQMGHVLNCIYCSTTIMYKPNWHLQTFP
jgi:hypothetical protein